MAADLTTLGNILKNLYLPPIREQINTSTILLTQIGSSNEQVSGGNSDTIITPLMHGFAQAVGARAEGGTLPTARATQYKQSKTATKANYGRIQLTGHVIRATRDDRGAFVRAIGSEVNNMVLGIKNDMNRQCFGDGTGALTTTNGTGTATTALIVDDTQYLTSDMPIMINESTPVYSIISGVTDAANVVLSANQTWTDGIGLYRGESSGNSKDNEIMGLAGIVTASGALQTLNPSTAGQEFWAAAKVDSTTESLNVNDMQDCITAVDKKSGSINLIVTTFELRDAYAHLHDWGSAGARRFVNTMDLDYGFKALEYNGMPLVADKDCQSGVMYFLDTSVLSFQEKADWEWMDMDGSIWSRVANVEAYEATILKECNLVTSARNRCAKLTNKS